RRAWRPSPGHSSEVTRDPSRSRNLLVPLPPNCVSRYPRASAPSCGSLMRKSGVPGRRSGWGMVTFRKGEACVGHRTDYTLTPSTCMSEMFQASSDLCRWVADVDRVTHGAVIRLYRSAGTSDAG